MKQRFKLRDGDVSSNIWQALPGGRPDIDAAGGVAGAGARGGLSLLGVRVILLLPLHDVDVAFEDTARVLHILAPAEGSLQCYLALRSDMPAQLTVPSGRLRILTDQMGGST